MPLTNEAPMAATIEASKLPVNRETTDMNILANVSAEFTIFKFGESKLRVINNDGNPWFVANDVCNALQLTNSRKSLMALDDDEKSAVTLSYTSSNGVVQKREVSVVSESGMYTLILRCRDAVNKGTTPYSFRKWVTSDVLPSIRKTGKYEKNRKTTVDERTPLRDAVNMLVGKKGLRYDDAYNMVHQRFAIDSIDELELSQIPQAVEYIHRVILDGEFIGKQESLPKPELNLNYGMDFFDKYRWIVGDKALSAPWFYSPEMLTTNGDYPNPCGRLLADMKDAGYSVEAAIFQLQALQHHLCLCLRKIDRVQQAVTH